MRIVGVLSIFVRCVAETTFWTPDAAGRFVAE